MDFEFKNNIETKKKSDGKRFVYFIAIAIVLLAVAFGFTYITNYKKPDTSNPSGQEDPQANESKKDEKKLDNKNTMQDIKEFKKEITQNGSGEGAINGQTIVANYTGRLLNGTVFDSNVLPEFGHVQPFEFNLGQGMVIAGWDMGFQGMKVGEKATFYIPSEMAYGNRAAGDKIPANSDLIFDVELVQIK